MTSSELGNIVFNFVVRVLEIFVRLLQCWKNAVWNLFLVTFCPVRVFPFEPNFFIGAIPDIFGHFGSMWISMETAPVSFHPCERCI